jgi:ATP-dependent Clp protease ATP-binding subunit ClpB
MFQALSKKDIRKIVAIQFNIIKERLAENNIKLEADDRVLDYLGEIGYDPQFGARPLKRVLQKHILNELSKKILEGKISSESIVGITLSDEREIEFINLDEVEI